MSGWTASTATTVVSSYALDAWAAAAGVALVASGLLAGIAQPWTVALLLGTYVAWGLGLRTNLRANWSLLSKLVEIRLGG